MLLIGMIERLLANDRTAATNRSDPPWWSLKYDGVRRESSNQYISRFLAKVQIEQEYVSHSRLAFSFASESHLFLSLFIILSIFVPYYIYYFIFFFPFIPPLIRDLSSVAFSFDYEDKWEKNKNGSQSCNIRHGNSMRYKQGKLPLQRKLGSMELRRSRL